MARLRRSSLHNLPSQLTSFIGRDQEIADIKRLLVSNRHLTLTGAGGCGKTRLALRVATDLVEDYPDGVWLVQLAALSEPELMPHMIGSALNIAERPGRPLPKTLVDSLRHKSLLLVLDNCEHLLPASAEMADALLRGCAELRILATSRESLRIEGEIQYLVPPLSAPDPRRLTSVEDMARYEAVRLFTDRAKAVLPAFHITQQNIRSVAQVCSGLDGIPLAIELAAARVKVLAVEQIAARLDDRFRLLTGGSRSVLPRHQTLRATMDWSYDLLTEKELSALRRLSVFAGGWTQEAAEAVCAGGDVVASEILDLLTQLVNKSLVGVETQAGEARYELLETIRQYAFDRLVESGEVAMVRRRHRGWCLALAERARPKLFGPEQGIWLDWLEREHDNLRAALDWSKKDEESAEAGMRLAGALWWFWVINGSWSEGLRWLEGALLRADEAPPAVIPRVLRGACFFAARHGDYGKASTFGERGLALSRELQDRESTALCLIHLGGVATRQGDYSKAKRLLNESLAICHDIGEKWVSGVALSLQGGLAANEGELARAEAAYKQCLALFMEVGDKVMIADALRNLGLVTLRMEEYKRAWKFFTESLTLCKEIGNKWIVDDCLMGLAGVACAQDRYEWAARLFGAAEAWREILGGQSHPVNQSYWDQLMSVTRTHLGTVVSAGAWQEGRKMTVDQAIEYALAPLDSVRATQREISLKEHTGHLTPREQEVAALIARGLTNREIASSLVISERTADAHVQHILNKLGFNTRTQIAAWAVEHGLRMASGA